MTETTQATTLKAGESWNDTREVRKVNADDLLVDPNVQRPTRDIRLDSWGDWDPAKAEMVTVAERADGTLVVIEGQNRVLKLQRDHAGSAIKAIILPSPATGYAAEEASVARGIAGGRVQHSSYAKMDLELKAGDPYWQAAVEAMGEWEVSMAETGSSGPRTIVAVNTIGTLMHSYDNREDSQAAAVAKAAALLSMTVALIITTFDDKPKMWDRVLIQAVAGLLDRGAEPKRLSKMLQRMTPAEWMAETQRRRHRMSAVRYLATLILNDYNHSLRGNAVQW